MGHVCFISEGNQSGNILEVCMCKCVYTHLFLSFLLGFLAFDFNIFHTIILVIHLAVNIKAIKNAENKGPTLLQPNRKARKCKNKEQNKEEK